LDSILKKYLKDYTFLLVFAGVIVAFDQLTKYLVRTRLAFTEMWAPWDWMLPYIRIVHWKNTGAAFGMFQGMSWVFAGLAVLVSIAILYYFPQVPRADWALRVAMGMQLAGAVGNLIDRLTMGGSVTDFISVGNFAVFNVADASISTGVAVLIVGMLIKERQEKRLAEMQALAQPLTDPEPAAQPEEVKGD
jgi:signal peptidase II